ncbi:MAG TPA: LuxR C-terminal-related transcriptional regulator, partial [Roseiflexaceae bacterium]|nr:LuxR C-terminal-related transcriptional regulator [Roseiflexaceae bacterium]
GWVFLPAPAGSGKSALLAEWCATLPAAVRVGWLTLDPDDNDPQYFWRYLARALAPILPGLDHALRPILRGIHPLSGEAVVAQILNVAAAQQAHPAAAHAILIIDDYHVISDPAIHRALAYLIEHIPSYLCLVIAGRVDPPLPLARLRVRGAVLELRATDLRFTPIETAAFLRDAIGLSLNDTQLALLDERTEGWAAGLQLAALVLRDQPDVAGFLAAFNGSHRHVLDYLLDEVLQQQPQHLVAFMLQTAILDRLCGSLCDAVLGLHDPHAGQPATGDSYSQLVLDQLERANLLLIPLDTTRHWFRYHHLLRDVLRHRMQREPHEQHLILHRRAAAWFEQHAMTDDAIRHYLAADQPNDAARILLQRDLLRALARGEAAQIDRWLTALPDTIIQHYPLLSLVYARRLMRSRQTVALVETWLHRAEEGLANTEPAMPGVRAEIAATRAHLAITAGQYQSAAARCKEALAQLPADDGFGRAILTFMLGNALNEVDAAAAERIYAEATLLGRAHGNARAAVMSLVNRALLREQHADLDTAEQLLQQAVALSGGDAMRPLPTALGAYRLLGVLAYERNRLAEAEEYLARAVDLAQAGTQHTPLVMTLSTLALVRQAQAAPAQAIALIDEAQASAVAAGLIDHVHLLEARRAELQLMQGDQRTPAAWLATYDPQADWRPASHDGRNHQRALHLAYVRISLALGQPEPVFAVLARLAEFAVSESSPARLAEVLVLRATAYQQAGNQAAAHSDLEQACRLILPAGSIRVLRDMGPQLDPLIGRIIAEWQAAGTPRHEIARLRILLANSAAAAPSPHERTALPVPQLLAEPLTPRELEVLQLLAAGLSSSEIAARLIVSVNTVKTQLKSVYGKLDAHSRSAVLARARTFGLLDS